MEIKKKDVKVIILSGKARAGKDTTAIFMKDYYESKGLEVVILQYASSFKEYTKKITGWDGSDETKPREFLQMLGTSIIREKIDEEFVIKRMIQDIEVYSYFYDVVIISDARVVKEIEMIRDNFSRVTSINILRPDYESGLSSEQKNHITETELDEYNDFDYVLYNDKGLDELKDKASKLASEI